MAVAVAVAVAKRPASPLPHVAKRPKLEGSLTTDSILCNCCKQSLKQRGRAGDKTEQSSGRGLESGAEAIYQAL